MINDLIVIKTPILALAIAILLAAGAVKAEPAPPPNCDSVGCYGEWGSIYVDPYGIVRLTVPDGLNTSSLQCSLYGGQYFSLKRTHEGFKEIYTMLLAAQLARRTLYVRALENTPDCEILYAVSYP